MKKLKIIYLFNILILFLFIYNIYSVWKFNRNYNLNEGFLLKRGTVLKINRTSHGKSIIIKSNKKILTYIKNDNSIKTGDVISFSYEIKDSSVFHNFNTFNYESYLKSQGINYVVSISNYKKIGSNFIYRFKGKIQSFFEKKKSSSYINTFLACDKSKINVDVKIAYKENGISHLLCVSGFHILFLLSSIKTILSKLFKSNLIINSLLIIVSLLYLLMSDFSLALYRAILFYFINYFNSHFFIGLSKKQIFLITLNVCLFNRPYILYSSSFWYTFILSYFLVNFRFDNIIKLPQIIYVSVFAFFISMPLNAYLNYSINFLSLICNILLSGFICYVVYPASIFSLFIKPVDYILFYLIKIFESINLKISSITFFTIVIPKISIVFLFFLYVLIDLYFKRKNYLWFLIYMLMLIYSKFSIYFDNSMYVYFLDVGQGDMTVLVSSNHRNISIIDTGGIEENIYLSENIYSFLKSIGVNKIDNLILSHGDYDHMGEAFNLIEKFKVGKLIFNCGKYNELEKKLIRALNKKRIKYYACIKKLNINNNKLFFLQTKEYNNENDDSNVIYTELGVYKFMFMGDSGINKEKDLLDKYSISGIDVLKVGHHGSKTSSSKNFINEISPRYSIISVGKNNRYGHPNDEVLNNLKNSKVYRTDCNGSIMFKIKNNQLNISSNVL